MRKLATIRRIKNIEPIDGADFIVKTQVDGWECVAKKDEFEIGDLCVYFEVDSILPDHEIFEFMRPRKFRVRIAKFKGQISSGLVMPLSILDEFKTSIFFQREEGVDVTKIIGVKKHDPFAAKEARMQHKKKKNILDKYLSQFAWYRTIRRKIFKKGSFNFPDFISKTDEERVQNIDSKFFEQHNNKMFYTTEKLDGMSATYAVRKEGRFKRSKFYVCSRRLWLWQNDGREWWQIAKKYDIFKRLLKVGRDIAIQGEIIGPKCNGNKYKLKEIDFYVFNVIDVKSGKRFSVDEKLRFCEDFGFKHVPLLFRAEMRLDKHMDAKFFVEMADGDSTINEKCLREGLVFRDCFNDHVSFKAVSQKFLLRNDE